MPYAVGDTKICSSCRVMYSPVATGFNVHRRCKDGWQNCCKVCKAKMTRNWKYGLKSGQIVDMNIAQDGRCAICACERQELVLDHCHASGKIRGLLCRPCNAILGMCQDKIDVLEAAIDYLRDNRSA